MKPPYSDEEQNLTDHYTKELDNDMKPYTYTKKDLEELDQQKLEQYIEMRAETRNYYTDEQLSELETHYAKQAAYYNKKGE